MMCEKSMRRFDKSESVQVRTFRDRERLMSGKNRGTQHGTCNVPSPLSSIRDGEVGAVVARVTEYFTRGNSETMLHRGTRNNTYRR